MVQLPVGSPAHLRIYKYHGPLLERLWYALKGIFINGGHRLMGVALYGQLPGEDFAPIRTTKTGALMTAPDHRETLFSEDESITLVETAYPPGFPSSIGYWDETFDVERYNYVSVSFITDEGNLDLYVDQSEDNPFVQGEYYTVIGTQQQVTIDGNTRYRYVIVQKLVHKYLRIRIENWNGGATENVYQFAVKAFMVSQ